jgi:hypothetical protein
VERLSEGEKERIAELWAAQAPGHTGDDDTTRPPQHCVDRRAAPPASQRHTVEVCPKRMSLTGWCRRFLTLTRSSTRRPGEALQAVDEATLEVFWRDWPEIIAWARSLWQRLNEVSRGRPPHLRIPTSMRSVRAGDRGHDQVVAQ